MTQYKLPHQRTFFSTYGFTLIEMSIVLVIIGLVIGGALAGKAMIETAKFRELTTDAVQMQTRINTYIDKFGFYPGDHPEAASFWPATDNGDGDGMVDYNERHDVWQQMALSGILEGSYTGNGSGGARIGINQPPAPPPNSGYGLRWHANVFGRPGTFLEIGGQHATGYDVLGEPIFTPIELFGMDKKFDDGDPQTGEIVARHALTTTQGGASNACLTTYSAGGTYRLDITLKGCRIFFWQD